MREREAQTATTQMGCMDAEDPAGLSGLSSRAELVAFGRRLWAGGYVVGADGNLSVRDGDGMLITPTSVPYEKMRLEQIVFMGLDGSVAHAQKPSSEWRFHLDILRSRGEVNAVVHAHPPYATILSIMGLEIPPIHYMIAAAGGASIRCSPYATYGTAELSEHAVKALEDRFACLLGHHGMIAVGPSLARALWLAVEVETLARQYHGCLQIGTPSLLSKSEIGRVRQKMAGYGHADS